MNESILHTAGLTKNFGGLTAVNKIDFSISPKEIHAIIGPNGAGKTTFFNLITGKVKTDAGKVFYYGKDITNLPPHVISRRGIAFSFQVATNFPRLSVMENMVATLITARKKNLHFYTDAMDYTDIKEKAYEVLEEVGLVSEAGVIAGTLGQADSKRLDIAIAIASEPKLLLLDEPTAGMAVEEVKGLIKLIEMLRGSAGLTILYIEHNMSVAFSISDRITVLNQGNIISSGRPEEIKEDQNVIEAYLGTGI